MKRLLLRLPLLLVLAGCTQLPPTAATSPAPANTDALFARLADEYVAGYLAWRPQNGTALGWHQYDGLLTDFSQASLDRELARLKAFNQRLGELDTTRLSPQAFYDFRILRSTLQRELFSFDSMRIYWQNPMTYAGAVDLNIYIKRNFAPLEQRVRSMIFILRQVPQVMAAARANLAEALPRPQVELAIDMANGGADFLSQDLVSALRPVKNAALMAEFSAINGRAVAELRAFATWLKDQRLPQANGQYALGRARYSQMLHDGELLNLSPEQLLDIGMRELRHQQAAFAQAAREIDPRKPAVEVFQAIQADHPTEQSLIPDTVRDLEMIRQFVVDRQILTLPSRVRAQVKETPQYLRATGFASMDTPGPFETQATEAYYYVTPPEPGWPAQQKEQWLTAFNYYTTDIVSIHEAYPGHYVQFLALKASPADKIEKMFGSYAFIEGWAHYAEQMMVDSGFGATALPSLTAAQPARAAKYRLAQADEALLRCCRLCASIQMHCQGMSVEQATRFFQENCYYAEKPARQEAMRGAYDPEYLYYTVGKLEFLKLREDYRKQEGAGFSLRRFHDEVLRHGMPPIRLLREVLLRDPATWDQVL